MTEQTDGSAIIPEAATPEIKQRRSFSIVWIVPIVALLIGLTWRRLPWRAMPAGDTDPSPAPVTA